MKGSTQLTEIKHHPSYCRIVSLVILWGILFLLVYKVLTLETTYEEYDPFAILQVDSVSVGGVNFQEATPLSGVGGLREATPLRGVGGVNLQEATSLRGVGGVNL